MAKPEIQIIDAIELVNRVHNKVSTLIKHELAKEDKSDLKAIKTLNEADDIVINTLKEMLDEASREIKGK